MPGTSMPTNMGSPGTHFNLPWDARAGRRIGISGAHQLEAITSKGTTIPAAEGSLSGW